MGCDTVTSNAWQAWYPFSSNGSLRRKRTSQRTPHWRLLHPVFVKRFPHIAAVKASAHSAHSGPFSRYSGIAPKGPLIWCTAVSIGPCLTPRPTFCLAHRYQSRTPNLKGKRNAGSAGWEIIWNQPTPGLLLLPIVISKDRFTQRLRR